MHPSRALFQDQLTPAFLPVCDHYAGSEKLMRKSMDLQQTLGPVFDITFDCEDGAATGSEANHAKMVCELLNSPENQFSRIGVRVHDIQHDAFEQDLSLIIPATAQRLAYIVLPKVNSADQVANAICQINDYAFSSGRNNLPIHVLIETHDALADVTAIAALPQVECLSFGIMDFVSSHYGAIPSSAMSSPTIPCEQKLNLLTLGCGASIQPRLILLFVQWHLSMMKYLLRLRFCIVPKKTIGHLFSMLGNYTIAPVIVISGQF